MNNHRLAYLVTAVVTCALAVTIAYTRREGNRLEEAPIAQGIDYDKVATPRPKAVAFEVYDEAEDERITLFGSEAYYQSVMFERDGHTLIVIDEEIDPLTDTFLESSHSYVTSFDLQLVEQRVPNEFYVVGKKGNGKFLIEKWQTPPSLGARTATREFTATPIGISAPQLPTVNLGVVGDVWVAPMDRGPRPQEIREVILDDLLIDGAIAARVDPDGRFMLILSQGGEFLYQLPFENNAVPTVICSSASIPDLASMGCIDSRQEVSAGRVYLMTSSGNFNDGVPHTNKRIALLDGDNDGVFDIEMVLSYEQYIAMDWQWVDQFNWQF